VESTKVVKSEFCLPPSKIYKRPRFVERTNINFRNGKKSVKLEKALELFTIRVKTQLN